MSSMRRQLRKSKEQEGDFAEDDAEDENLKDDDDYGLLPDFLIDHPAKLDTQVPFNKNSLNPDSMSNNQDSLSLKGSRQTVL